MTWGGQEGDVRRVEGVEATVLLKAVAALRVVEHLGVKER